ncbi:MAG: hypothetical protein KatS3mg011_1992 [Acidimicrobiia bacterium]|nr:MAG: hypothetical protein KatS3mg011_1992 [Acidimicrobiia bacterium]
MLLLGSLLIYPVLETLVLGSQSVVVALTSVLGWRLLRSRDSWLGGGLIGLATTLKVFPGLLVVPMLFNRRLRGVAGMLLVFGGSNLAGLGLPGVDGRRALQALLEGGGRWSGLAANGSLWGWLSRDAGLGAAGIASVILIAWWLAWRRERIAGLPYPFWVASALLVVPLGWSHYDVALLPCVGEGLGGEVRTRTVSIGIWIIWMIPLLGWLIGFDMEGAGVLSTLVRSSVVLSVGLWPNVFGNWRLEGAGEGDEAFGRSHSAL